MKRQIVPTVLVMLLLSGVVGFAYFSNHPDSPWLERAEAWPAVGPVASWFRTAYLGPELPQEIVAEDDSEAQGSATEPEDSPPGSALRRPDVRPRVAQAQGREAPTPGGAGQSRATPEGGSPRSPGPATRRQDEDALLRSAGLRRAGSGPTSEPRPDPRTASAPTRRAADPPAPRGTVEVLGWELVRPGLAVRVGPDPAAAVRLDLPAMSYLPVLSRSDPWIEVLVAGERGWIDPSQEPPFNRRRARRGLLRHRAEPVQSNDGFVLKAARKLLDVKRETGELGPYSLYSDVADEEMLDFLNRAASLAEESYFARYGRLPSGNPRRSVLLFAREQTYRELAQQTSDLPGGGNWQAGHAARGVLGMFVEGRDREALAGTLVHEIAHLLNDRSLAYNLPLWLEEGIAGDLGGLWIEPDPNRTLGRRIEVQGADARYLSLRDLVEGGKAPPLAVLLALDREGFYRSEIRQHAYALSFAFVRYLLDGEGSRHADGFREFLGRIAGGLGANLIEQLGVDGAELEAGFYRWLSLQIDAVQSELERRMRGG